MNYSKIHVQYRDGSKPKGTKAVLGFTRLLGGVTKPADADANGTAIVEHSVTGQAEVYVSGNKCGSFHAPGETAMFISWVSQKSWWTLPMTKRIDGWRAASISLLALVFAAAGCSTDHYEAETRLNADLSVERTIRQPGDAAARRALEEKGWQSVRGIEWKDFETAGPPAEDDGGAEPQPEPADPDEARPGEDEEKEPEFDFLEACGRFESAERIPVHFEKATSDGTKTGRLVPTAVRRDLGFVAEYRWEESLTDVVNLNDLRRACEGFVDMHVELYAAVIERAYGGEYNVEPLAAWARTEGKALFTELAEAYFEVSARKQSLRKDEDWAEAELDRQLQAVCTRHGIDAAEGSLVREFAKGKLQELLRKRDGSPPTETVVEGLMDWWGIEGERLIKDESETEHLQKTYETVVIERYGSEEKLTEKTDAVTTEILGLYGPHTSPRLEFRYTLSMPGRIVETNGQLLSLNTVRFRFQGADAYPYGYSMSARSLELSNEAAEKLLRGNPLADRKVLLEYVEIVTENEELLKAMRAYVETGTLGALDKYRGNIEADARSAERAQTERLVKLLGLDEQLAGHGSPP